MGWENMNSTDLFCLILQLFLQELGNRHNPCEDLLLEDKLQRRRLKVGLGDLQILELQGDWLA